MGQSTFKWAVTYGNGTTILIRSTAEDLPKKVDFSDDIVSIVRIELV